MAHNPAISRARVMRRLRQNQMSSFQHRRRHWRGGHHGAGIAQVAAQAGCRVKLFDAREGAAAANAKTAETLNALAAKGQDQRRSAHQPSHDSRRPPIWRTVHDCDLIVEAIVENLDAKRTLFKSLEGICAASTVLATNTSSISITAIAAGLARPENVVGMHFSARRR